MPFLISRDANKYGTSILLPTFPLLFIDSYLCIVAVHTQTRTDCKIKTSTMCLDIGKYL